MPRAKIESILTVSACVPCGNIDVCAMNANARLRTHVFNLEFPLKHACEFLFSVDFVLSGKCGSMHFGGVTRLPLSFGYGGSALSKAYAKTPQGTVCCIFTSRGVAVLG